MRSSLATRSEVSAAAPEGSPTSLVVRGAIGLVAGALVTAALFLPLWQARLDAPQYPGGLTVIAYGDAVVGDVGEVSSLNHYVGMRAFDPADVPEMALWPLAVAAALAAVAVATLFGRRWPGRLARLFVWLVPVGVLADIQWRLYQYGHDLDPGAALRIPEFTPLVVGPTKVWNFTTHSRPGTGLLVITLAAALLTFGPGLVRRARTRRPATGSATGSATGVVLLAAVVGLLAWPGPARAAPAGDLEQLLAAARPGDVIVVPPGHHVGNFVVDVPVTLRGEGRPMLMGPGTGTTLTVRAAGTTIEGLHVHGSGAGPTGSPAGIRIEADDVTVTSTTVEGAYHGIAVVGAARVRLVDNHVIGRIQTRLVDDGHAVTADEEPAETTSGGGVAEAGAMPEGHGMSHADVRAAGLERGDAISIWESREVLVRGNRVEGARDGVYISFGDEVLVDGNEVHDSRYAVHSMYADDLVLAENVFVGNFSGAVLMYGGPVLVLRNRIEVNRSSSTGFGVLLKDVESAHVERNTLAHNRVGLHLDGPTGDTGPVVRANTVARNDVGVALLPTARGVFSANSFADNHVQVSPKGSGVAGRSDWSDHGFGNYWSNYRGYELFDGKGAVEHREGGSTDRMLTRAPVLTAIATSPAFRVMDAVEQRWTRSAPVVVDRLPLTRPVVPVGDLPPAQPFASRLAIVVGLVLLGTVAGMLIRLQGRHPRSRRIDMEIAHAHT